MIVRTPTIGGQKRLITPFGSGAPKVHRAPSDGLTDTFLMSRRQTLFPQLATVESGTWAWSGSASVIFGGTFSNSAAAFDTDALSWPNVFVGPGDKIRVLSLDSDNGCAFEFTHGGDTLGSVDFWAGAISYNKVREFTVSKSVTERATLTMTCIEGAGGAPNDDNAFPVQIEIVAAEARLGSSLDDLPWHGHCPAFSIDTAEYNNGGWIDYKSTITPTQTTSAQWGSYIPISHATYDWRVRYKFWCPQGTHTLNLRHLTGTSGGTITALVNGGATTPTTFSTSAGSTNYNVSTDLTFTAETTGMQTLELSGAAGVTCPLQWISWRKTSAIGAITATGATYGVESLELWPWFADANTTWNTVVVGASHLHYGYIWCSLQNSELQWATNINNGTYAVDQVVQTDANSGITHLSIDGGSDLDTVDNYSTGSAQAVTLSMSGSLTAGVVALSMDSKNGSSTGYRNYQTFARLTRTGA